MKKRNMITVIFIMILFIYSVAGLDVALIEDIGIPSIVAYDLEKDSSNNPIYKTYLTIYTFGEQSQIFSRTYSGTSTSIVDSREERQLKIDKKFLVGLEKVDIISETNAEYGIRNIVDVLFKLPFGNDTAFVAVCRGDILDVLNYKAKGYPSSGDYIEGLLKNANQYNFFPKNLRLIDLFIALDSEGRTLKIPCIETTEEGIEITGNYLFKADKIIAKLNMEDTRLLNILSSKNSKGTLTLQKGLDKYIDYYSKVKRKVSCSKSDNKYNFTIDLRFKGIILSNELYKDLMKDPKEVNKFEKNMEADIELMCNEFISKMKNQYRVDCLELGRVAAAKYGRDTGIDWNRVVPDSNIKVNVSVKVDNQGRGDY